MTPFMVFDWYWIVGGDESRAWSSASRGYVQAWPADRISRIASEAELVEALDPYGIEGPMTLAERKSRYKIKVSTAAEVARGKYLTPGSLKAMSYLKVAQEAATYVATQGAGDYPLLAARVASGRYANLAAAAQGTLAIEQASTTAAAAIDEIEDRAKVLIDAASTAEQVQAAANVTFP